MSFTINNSSFFYERVKAKALLELTKDEMILLAFNLNHYLNMTAVLEYEPVIETSHQKTNNTLRIVFYFLVLVLLAIIAFLILVWKQTIKINWTMDEAALSACYGGIRDPFCSRRGTICYNMNGRVLPDPPPYDTEEDSVESNYMPLSIINPLYGNTESQ